MKKKIICIAICMLMCATVSTVTGTNNSDVNPSISAGLRNYSPNRDPWDVLAEYDIGATGETGLNGNAGAEFDGTYLYSTRWASNLIHKYDIDGNLVEEFSIPGVTGLRDLAYDGTQYMYGGAAAGTIWKMDFTTKTLEATITGTFQSRAIAYDYDLDVLYVSNWADPVWIVNPTTGAIEGTFNLGIATSTYGFAYDPDPAGPDGPYLWVFDQTTGATSTIYQWDLTAGAMTGFTYNVNNDIGSGIGIAGGLWASPDFASGLFCIGGCVQDSTAPGVTDWLFAYELYVTNLPPLTPDPPTGPTSGTIGVSYTFTATTTDPEGDPIEYWFEWGDGENSGWVTPGTAQHAWAAPGDYDITVKARDAVNGGVSGWSGAHTISILDAPLPKVEWIKGGLFKVSASVTNMGGVAATNVPWTISLVGGAFIGKETTGTIASIGPGVRETIKSKFILGFGPTVITVTFGDDSKSQDAQILLFFIKI